MTFKKGTNALYKDYIVDVIRCFMLFNIMPIVTDSDIVGMG